MSDLAEVSDELRAKILARPDMILEDPDVLRALIEASERSHGANIVDIRGVAMQRLESRLGRLEDTHRSVIAAAYENLAGTNQVHRAILRMLEPSDFADFLLVLCADVSDILRVEAARRVLEAENPGEDPALRALSHVLAIREVGFIDEYLTWGRTTALRKIVLRQARAGDTALYGEDGEWIRSEACLKLELGPGRTPGMFLMGSEDPHRFAPTQGTDLLMFFNGALERAIRRWLA